MSEVNEHQKPGQPGPNAEMEAAVDWRDSPLGQQLVDLLEEAYRSQHPDAD